MPTLSCVSCFCRLALAATLFGVTTARLQRVVLDVGKSKLLDLGAGRSDWQRLAFRMELSPTDAPPVAGGVQLDALTLVADRCGGNFSRVRLDTADGAPAEFRLPTPELEAEILKAQAQDPLIRPYFLQQSADYERLKDEFIAHITSGAQGIPPGVVGLDGGIEALRLADFLVPTLRRCWESGEPWSRCAGSATASDPVRRAQC